MNTPCSLGESCACQRVGRAFRWIAPCPQAPAVINTTRAWGLWLPLGLSLSLAYGLNHYADDLGAMIGLILGLTIGFILLRCLKI